MTTRFVIRFDDVTPGMAWSKFAPFDALAQELNIPYLIGVVPDCRDPALSVEPHRADFWDFVRERVARERVAVSWAARADAGLDVSPDLWVLHQGRVKGSSDSFCG